MTLSTKPTAAALSWVVAVMLTAGMIAAPARAMDGMPTLDELLEISGRGEAAGSPAGSTERGTAADNASSGEARTDDAGMPSLDELLGTQEAAQGGAAGAADGGRVGGADETMEADAARVLSGESMGDSLTRAVNGMETIADRLVVNADAGPGTQRHMKEVIRHLEQVIAQAASQQQQQSSSSSSSSSSKRGQDTGTTGNEPTPGQQAQAGEDGQGEADGEGRAGEGQIAGDVPPPGSSDEAGVQQGMFEQGRSEWGNLPPRVRDDVHQGMSERFSAIYRRMTEAYYEKLAKEE